MRTHFYIAILVFALPGFLQAQPPSYIPKPDFTAEKSTSRDHHSQVSLGLSVGAGQYPIVSMPMMENGSSRVDGSRYSEDVRINRGASFNLNLSWQSKEAAYPVKLSGNWQRIATSPGAGLVTPASYSRLGLDLSTELPLNSQVVLIPALEARRSMYLNVDSGHFVDTISLKAALRSQIYNHLAVGVSYGLAPWAKFGVLQSGYSSESGTLKGSNARMSEIATTLNWNLSPSTDLTLTAAEENATVHLDNSDGYLAYGLPVATTPEFNGKKTYRLSVRHVSLGTVKKF